MFESCIEFNLSFTIVRVIYYYTKEKHIDETWKRNGQRGCRLILLCQGSCLKKLKVRSAKKETNAIILGEPPGEKPNSYSENDEMKLPDSGLIISYSTRYYKFLDEDVPAFEPDVRIDPKWKDFLEGSDAVLEWIISYCKK